jgi:hypothetical protein
LSLNSSSPATALPLCERFDRKVGTMILRAILSTIGRAPLNCRDPTSAVRPLTAC